MVGGHGGGAAHVKVAEKQRQEEEGLEPSILFEDTPPVTSLPAIKPHFLPPPPQSATDWEPSQIMTGGEGA